MAQSIADIRRILYNSLSRNALGRVMSQLGLLADAPALERLQEMRESYQTLLRYYFDGIDDPDRDTVARHLTRQCYELTDDLCAARTTRPASSHPVMEAMWKPLRFTETETEAFAAFLKGGLTDACLAVTAVTLNLLDLFDEPKLECLAKAAYDPRPEVSGRALTGVTLTLAAHARRLELQPASQGLLTLLLDDPGRVKQCQDIAKQLILSKETESLSADIRDNILPALSRLAPELNRKSAPKRDDDDNMEALHDLLSRSGLDDKMQRYTEMQLEGCDINYSTFSKLKNFSFFNKMENWLMPFDLNHPEIAPLMGVESQPAEGSLQTLFDSVLMCDSDKYSFYLNIAQLPPEARRQLTERLQGECGPAREAGPIPARIVTNGYIQDLYRFYRLYPGASTLTNVFDLRFDLHRAPLFRLLNPGGEFLRPWADYLLKHGCAEYALSAYVKLDETEPASADICRKAGYCHQASGQYSQAIEYYRKAEVLEPDDAWTQSRMAACLLKEGRADEARGLYEALDAAHPNQWRYLLPLVKCCTLTGNYEAAGDLLYKLEYLFPDKAENSEEYHLYKGHCLWKRGDRKEAAAHYAKALKPDKIEEELRLSGFPFKETELNALVDYLRYNRLTDGSSPSQ